MNELNCARTLKGTKPYLVVQRLDLLRVLAFPLTDLIRVSHPKELRCHLDEPLWFDSEDVMAVLTGGEYKFVIDEPFWCSIEQRACGVYVDRCTLDERLVTLLRILLRRMSEEA